MSGRVASTSRAQRHCLINWILEGRELQRQSERTRREIADSLARMNNQDPDRWLDLDRLSAIKWGDKIIDPSEVVYVLRGIS